ncbi:M20/M25/M40 family metallo-hydrolase [Nocardioides panacis]|uniref:M20/M25/M40 family metallo-hydrolase n=1 Tax=Nocardioides panacis TaxID=2849501 RepID=A0A975Y000_9ACTN|nr:M20/M25/M40 family metallo-hydrolase [Nocardioides panacis]QWZ07943.1 M20/M25/M40 family metallo-hydrolase [Nocardioides panacis]
MSATLTEKLRTLVRIPTISYADPTAVDTEAFDLFVATLAELFPLLHGHLALTRIGQHGLLFHWPGASDERPVVLMAHLDVVPVDESAPWQHPAFGAVLADGAVWGRGTLDDKGSLVAICEAVETLLADGFTPAQDVWLSFGADEEVSGTCAPAAVVELERRGVLPWFVLDEGGAVAADAFPGVAAPLAVVGVTEKGTTNLELRTEGRGGHSSMPSRMDTTARLARAILRLERSPFPARVPAPTLEMLRRVAPHAPAALRPLLAHAHKAPPLLARALVAAGPETAAMTRTTAAVTTLQGSPALNVIASTARAGVNVRVLVGDTVASVVEHVRAAVHDDSVTVEVLEAGEASPVSPTDDDAFRLVTATIEEVFPDAIATPYVMMGATDARFFTALCPRVYRYTPFRMSRPQRASLHSFDEHLRVDDLADGARWYRRLVEGLPA